MSLKLMGRKKGMTRLFDETGNLIVCTVIFAEPNIISQLKKKEKDNCNAIQLATEKVSAKQVSKPMQGHFAKAGIEPRRFLSDSCVDDVEQYAVGQEISIDYFADSDYVDVSGVSKGKGYQGVIKRHHFSGGPAAHGSGFHRHGGSCGMRTSPGRCLPGQKKAGRMGADHVTIEHLKVLKIDKEKQVILVQGAIPGAREGLVFISKSKKKLSQKKKK